MVSPICNCPTSGNCWAALAASARPWYGTPTMDAAPTLVATLGLGFSLGLLHALDADHLVAVATMVSARPSPRRAALVGLVWGLGHGAAITTVGLAVLVFHWAMPRQAATWFELAVAAMLVGLGAGAVRRGLGRARMHAHVHLHDGRLHAHRHVHLAGEAAHEGLVHALAHVGRRPFLVGLVHGLAGSAGLTLMVLATIPSPVVGLCYVLVFGAGVLVAMSITSTLVALPATLASLGAVRRHLEVAVGAAGMVFGSVLGLRLLGQGVFWG